MDFSLTPYDYKNDHALGEAVEGRESHEFDIDPDVLRDWEQLATSTGVRPINDAVELTAPWATAGGLANEFQPPYALSAYSGQDGQERATTPSASSFIPANASHSHAFQWQTCHTSQPQSPLSPGNRGPLADSVTAQSEYGDNLNAFDKVAHTHSAAQQQPVLPSSNSPIDCPNVDGHLPNTTLQSQITSPDANSLPPSDPHYEQIAQFQAAFIGPSENNSTSQSTIAPDQTLTFNGPAAAALRRAVMDHEGLVDMINYILASTWYKEGGKEELPNHTLQKYIHKRRSPDAQNCPFGAFVSQRPPYNCLFCNDHKGRVLCRAIGHARSHFGYKFDGVHTNRNAKADRERRARSPTYDCAHCHIPIAKQNRARHERTTGHKLKASSSSATASTSAQK